jgi:hypothetical protein
MTGIGCCARAASGHTVAPASSVMNSRRLMGYPQGQWITDNYSRVRVVHRSKSGRAMTGSGQNAKNSH